MPSCAVSVVPHPMGHLGLLRNNTSLSECSKEWEANGEGIGCPAERPSWDFQAQPVFPPG